MPKTKMIEKPVSARLRLAHMAKDDFKIFIRESWKVLEPATPLLWNWHIDAIAEHLTAVLNGEITRLVVNIAPGHMKSTIFSVMWPAWSWLNHPDIRWLCASHSLGLAIRDNRNCRSLIESEWYRSCYPDAFSLASDQNAKSFFENNKRGYRLAVSVGSKGIGKRGTQLLIDDSNDAKASMTDIENTIYWFGQTWLSRLNDQERGGITVVGQRLAERDLCGYILRELSGWEHLNLPTEYEPARKCYTNIKWNEKSVWKGCDPREVEGELLWKEKFPPSVLQSLKVGLGPMGYSAQHQQRPVPAGGIIFKSENERLFTIDHEAGAYLLETPRGMKAVPIADCWIVTTSDVAAKEKEQNDWTVFANWAITPTLDVLLLDVKRGHWTIPEQEEMGYKVFQQFNDDRYQGFYFEDVGYQSAIGQNLVLKGVPCLPFSPTGKGDKVLRATSASIWQQLGKTYFLKSAHWLSDWCTELYGFPKAPHDDQVDVFSMICLIVRKPRPGVYDENNAKKIDTTLSIEQILDADEIVKEQAGQEAKDKEQELANPALVINPFEWIDAGREGGWYE